jgi:ABC-type nickel/cobalt efflux system permease component RcnA
MAEETKHHHHHHHHVEDDATRFKRKSLASIQRWKIIKKWGFRILCALAIIMAILVMLVYTIG